MSEPHDDWSHSYEAQQNRKRNKQDIERCEACKGMGNIQNTNYQGDTIYGCHRCPWCNGTGFIITQKKTSEFKEKDEDG